MGFLRKLKLKRKMIYAFTFIIVLVFIAVGFGMFGLNENQDQISKMNLITQEADLAHDIQGELLTSQIVFKNFLNTGEKSLIVDFTNHESDMENKLEDLKAVHNSEERDEFIAVLEKEIAHYNNGFKEFQRLDDEKSNYYSELSAEGTTIVNAFETISDTAIDVGDKDIQIIIGEAESYLLQARLHAMKFFTFHSEDEFLNYLDDFESFKNNVNKLYYLSKDNNFKLDYSLLIQALQKYKLGMNELHTLINELDVNVDNMDLTEAEIISCINDITESVQAEKKELEDQVKTQSMMLITISGMINVAVVILTIFIGGWLLKIVLVPIQSLTTTFKDIASGDVDLDFRLNDKYDDEIGLMSKSFNEFMINLKDIMDKVNHQNWTKTAQNELNKVLRNPEDLTDLSNNILSYLCKYIDAQVGTMYLNKSEDTLELTATYAFTNRKGHQQEVRLGEGLIGQCFAEKNAFIMTNLPEGYLNIQSGLGEKQPRNVVVFPCVYEDEVKAVVEIGTFASLNDEELDLLRALSDAIAISIHSTNVQIQLKNLLEKTITQSEELQMQQEELRQSNEELEEQTRALKDSEQILQAQQEELRVSNEELEQRTKQLELQKKALDENNRDILIKQQEIIEKAEALELANTYKSEFLANMSHELRTPLNSILVLSQLLGERDNNKALSSKELEFANTINTSGNDLLTLINDVLDLSKVEAGHLDIHNEEILFTTLLKDSERMFKPMTDMKDVHFRTELDEALPKTMVSDALRIQQVIKNLVSNSIKFTEKGEVAITIRKPSKFECDSIYCERDEYVAIEVSDTGLGIPKEKQQIIFEAFRQTDGTTSRKYGGTGLGLTISRELAELLSGHILLESTIGEGSKFVFLLPLKPLESNVKHVFEKNEEVVLEPQPEQPQPVVEKFIDKIQATNRDNNVLLIIEDDVNFSSILKDLAEDKNFKCYVAHDGKSGLQMAIDLKPTGIVLDLGLPDIDGVVLAEKLGRLEATSNIPIHIISGMESDTQSLLPSSVIGFLKKPVDIKSIYQTLAKIESVSKTDIKKLLVIGECSGESFDQFSSLGKIEVEKVLTTDEAEEKIASNDYECVVLDIELKEGNSKKFLEEMTHINGGVPVIIYSENELNKATLDEINQYTDSIILKSPKSEERLMDEVSLFLHGMQSTMREHPTRSSLHHEIIKDELKDKVKADSNFNGKSILVVDDDERNVFALTNVLLQHGFEISVARDGIECIEKFKAGEISDLILMDIMMPKMDGYEAIRNIRQLTTGKDVPIIALTAKAMKDDKQKCIEAGANDYMTKPINVEKLLSLLKVWLS